MTPPRCTRRSSRQDPLAAGTAALLGPLYCRCCCFLCALLLFGPPLLASAFSPPPTTHLLQGRSFLPSADAERYHCRSRPTRTCRYSRPGNQEHADASAPDDDEQGAALPCEQSTPPDRRSFVASSAAALFATVGFGGSATDTAAAAAPSAASTAAPVCVIGCNGRTGTEVVSYLLSKSMSVVATSRSGTYNNAAEAAATAGNLLTEAKCDVTDPATIASAISAGRSTAAPRAVVFAASASKEGGTPASVDNKGLVSVAKSCIAANVPHLVIVSSGAVTKPSSPVYLFLNLFGNIMAEKIRGEDAVRELYARHNNNNSGEESKKLTYTIVRPGGLTTDPPRGPSELELNQGDTKSGRIARADVAALCVECLAYPQLTGGTTLECYDADTGAPLANVGMSNIMKAKTTEKEAFVSGKERRGDTWEGLFRGLEKDVVVV